MRALCLFALLLLAGCGADWTNPSIQDPEAAANRLARDKALCERHVQSRMPKIANNERRLAPRRDVSNFEDFDMDMRREQMFDDCMQAQGWKRK